MRLEGSGVDNSRLLPSLAALPVVTEAILDIYTKELKKGGKNEDGANSSNTKPTGK